jgi:hypothetical protein
MKFFDSTLFTVVLIVFTLLFVFVHVVLSLFR